MLDLHILAWIVGIVLTLCLCTAGTFLVWHMLRARERRDDRRDRRDERDLLRPNEERPR